MKRLLRAALALSLVLCLAAYTFTGKVTIDDPSLIYRLDSTTIASIQPRYFEVRLIAMSLWFPAILFAIAPLWRGFVAIRRWRMRPPPGCCPACGYDLRATPDRCPECGVVPNISAAASG